MALVTTKTAELRPEMSLEERYAAVFEPIVRLEMRESWKQNWKKWFCTTGTIEENLTPGKLKCKYFNLDIKVFTLF